MGYRYFLDTNKRSYDGPSNPIPKKPTVKYSQENLEAVHLATWRALHAVLRRAQSEDKTVEFVCWGILDSKTGEKLYVSDVLIEYVDAV
jgi:hypothetical protein